ncbi:hypothetical protein D3C74_90990 [compost metagenome]
MNGVTWLFVALSGLCMTLAMTILLPRTGVISNQQRLMKMIGYSAVQKSAMKVGWNFKLKQYLLLIGITIFAGYFISVLTNNLLFVIAGGMLSFFIPTFIISMVSYRKRKDMLMDLPHNLRLLASKFRDSKSLQKSLQNSLPMMSGSTKPIFVRLYRSLEVGIELSIALKEAQDELRFRKFDDLCDKLIDGNRAGYTTRSVESIRETIEDISFDIELLQDLDIQNRSKRVAVHIIVGFCWAFPFLFAYMESQATSITIQEPIGKILLLTMFLTSLVTYLMRDKYMRLNLNNL